MMDALISVLLVDDHPVVRAGFKRLLDSYPDVTVTGEASSGEEACQRHAALDPKVTIMDLSIPDVSGLNAIEKITKVSPSARILVLSVHEGAPFPERAMEAGAMGYLSKRCAPEELVTAVRDVAQGRVYFGAEIARHLAMSGINGKSQSLRCLTRREFEIFTLIASGRSVVEIAGALFLSPKTVHAHRASILRKLNLNNTAELVRLAIRHQIIEVD